LLAKPAEVDERKLTSDDRRTVVGEVGPIDTAADPAAVGIKVKEYYQESQRSAARSVLCRWYMGRALLAMWIRLAPEKQWEKWYREAGLTTQEVSRCMRLARAFRQVKEVIGLTWGEACHKADEVIRQMREAKGRRTRSKKKEQEKKKEQQGHNEEQDQDQHDAKDQKDGSEKTDPAADLPDILPFPVPVPKRAPKCPRAKAEEEHGMSYLPGHLVMFAATDLHEAVQRLAGRPVNREEAVIIRAILEAVREAAELLEQLVKKTPVTGANTAAH
jgi:hypothetical protein